MIKQGMALRADLAGVFLLPADLNLGISSGARLGKGAALPSVDRRTFACGPNLLLLLLLLLGGDPVEFPGFAFEHR